MDPMAPSDFANEFNRLTSDQQADVLAFMRQLQTGPSMRQRSAAEEAERKQAILSLVGSIPPDDLAIMSRVIEEDCGRIDHDGW